MYDKLGDKIKLYEIASYRQPERLPIVARLDGKNFSKLTSGGRAEKPFDKDLSFIFDEVAKDLIAEFNADWVYTQSDEITLCWYYREGSELPFGGKIQKLTSILASYCTLRFTNNQIGYFKDIRWANGLFDCRAFYVPSIEDAIHCLLWRESDCRRNSIQVCGQHYLGKKTILGLNNDEVLSALREVGFDWNSLDVRYRWGYLLHKRVEMRKFTPTELSLLPEKHDARSNPDLEYKRVVIKEVSLPVGNLKIGLDILSPEV